jgi:DNA-binding HxlR family transcriptional regulator
MPDIPPHRQWTPLARALAATGDKWTLLIVLALAQGQLRLSRLKDRLPGISTGVLEQHLQHMIALDLLSRQRFREVPPRVELALTDSGRELVPIASALARWGMRHHWSAPHERAQLHADALVRQLPALLGDENGLVDGTIEAVLAKNGDRLRYCFQIAGGQLQATEEPVPAATAVVEGDEVAWIAALGPARDCSGLNFNGERQLAKRILDALPERA